MTEKRFVIKPSAMVDDCFVIIDDEKEYSFPVLESTLNFMFCKALNELSDENEQLKQQLKEKDDFIDEVWRKYEDAHGLSIDNTDWF